MKQLVSLRCQTLPVRHIQTWSCPLSTGTALQRRHVSTLQPQCRRCTKLHRSQAVLICIRTPCMIKNVHQVHNFCQHFNDHREARVKMKKVADGAGLLTVQGYTSQQQTSAMLLSEQPSWCRHKCGAGLLGNGGSSHPASRTCAPLLLVYGCVEPHAGWQSSRSPIEWLR